MNKSNLRFGVIGYGRIGARHAHNMQEQGELVAVCDTNSSALNQAKQDFGWTTNYATFNEFIAAQPECDVVAVCTPNYLHAEQTIALLHAGYHVVCEKPMALTKADGIAMIKAAETTQKQLFIVKQNRFNPPIVALKSLVDSGKLGKIYSAHLNCFWNRNEAYYTSSAWKGKLQLDGGTLFTQFSHFIDLLLWICGDYEQVQGTRTNAQHTDTIEFDDCGALTILFKNKTIGSIHYTVNSANKNMEGSLTLFTEFGTIKIGGQYLNEVEYCEPAFAELSNLELGNGPNNYGTYQGSMSNHDKVYKNVTAVLLHGDKIAVNSREGILSVALIEEFYNKNPI